MSALIRSLWMAGMALIAMAVLLAACASPQQPTPAVPLVPTANPTAPPGASASPMAASPPTKEWILIDLPPTASQLEFGAEVYRLVCRDCHGDRGQGLTAEWRATWAPKDQNCWQSKCHALNHPPDGFFLPVAPPVVGTAAMSGFRTAGDLHDFIQAEMPWYHPGSLTAKDSWAVTAYVLQMNQIHASGPLDAATAAQIHLH